MVDNQHKKIKGYRDLSQEEIERMNAIKDIGTTIEDLVSAMEMSAEMAEEADLVIDKDLIPDQRWVAIGKTHLQQGIMALVRAVAKPESF